MEYESRLGFWKVDQKVKKREKLRGVVLVFGVCGYVMVVIWRGAKFR